MIKWTLQEVYVKDLKDLSKNPRQIGKQQFEKLSQMIEKFGLIDKPIINEDFTIIGGHQRVKILKKKKIKTVECWVADQKISQEDINELCIGLNLHQGTWDYDVLANHWNPIDLLEYGFTEKQLFDSCKEAEEILEESKKEKGKKNKCCPNCGHEF